MMQGSLRIFLGFFLVYGQSAVKGDYVPLKECSKHEVCDYEYSASQVSSMSGVPSKLYIRSTVEIACESIGTFEDQDATRYCTKVKNTKISVQEEEKSLQEVTEAVNKLLSGEFCFVQGEEGKVLSVYHNPSEKTEIANYKKGIVAAFQANFKNTEVEVEEDTQSKHYAHYTYETIAPGHVIMHRTVESENIIQFSDSDLNGKRLNLQRNENIEYKNGKLVSSSGTAAVDLSGPVQSENIDYQSDPSEDSQLTYDANFASGGLTGTGEYTLKLTSCRKGTRKSRRSVMTSPDLAKGSLYTSLDQEQRDFTEISRLRENFPSIKKVLIGLHANTDDTTTSNMIKKLLILESVRGPLPGYISTVKEVAEYLNATSSVLEKDAEMRVLLYSFLAAEGSEFSQEILIHALEATKQVKERNSLIVQIAFMRNVKVNILSKLEVFITTSSDVTDTLLLAYGALASKSSPEVQNRIVQFLEQKMDLNSDHATLIHYIHSLGNTESSQANKKIVEFITHVNPSVRMAAVYGLRYGVEKKEVQDALLYALRQNNDAEFTEAVVRTLVAAAENKQLTSMEPIDGVFFEELLDQTRNNTVTRSILSNYVKLLGSKVPAKWNDLMNTMVQKRDAKWDEDNSVYDLVENINDRRSDLQNYPLNGGYLWGKSFGVSDLKLDVGFGAFMGYGGKANPTSFKLFARGVAQGYAFGYTKTAFEAQMYSINAPGGNNIQNRLYVAIAGKVLVDYSKEIPTCKNWEYPLYQSPSYTLLTASSKVFIYVAHLDFTFSLSAKLDIKATLTACINKCVQAKGTLVPSVTVTATADAAVNLLELVKGGIAISGSFQYSASSQLTGRYLLFSGPYEFCFQITHGWPNNAVSIYAYYQTRSVDWCSGLFGIEYPCGLSCWSDKNKWDAASKEWALPSYGPNQLWSSCDPAKNQCPAITKKH